LFGYSHNPERRSSRIQYVDTAWASAEYVPVAVGFETIGAALTFTGDISEQTSVRHSP
jgi:hypothetical protein